MQKIFLIASLLFLFAACKTETKNTTVKGTVKHFGNGELYFIQSGDEKLIDTVKVSNDQFEYSTNLQEPTVYMVNFGANQQPAFVILDKGNTTLSYEMNVLNSLEVKGGKDQEIYNSFLQQCKPVFGQMDSIGKIAAANEDDETLLGNLQTEFFRLDSILKGIQVKFIDQNKNSVATAFIAINYLNEKSGKTLEEVEKVYQSLEPAIQKTYYGKKLAEMAKQMQGTAIGQPAPDFTLNDVNGKPVSLSSFKGKVILLDFWASWCGPCRGENPHVVEAYKQFHEKGFDVLGVSLDDDKEDWLTAIEKDHLTWTHVSDLKGWSSAAATQYGIQSIPTNFLLDKDGKIIAKDLRGDALKEKLAEIFK
ncbi:MAG: AhpC/TSA family protein [Chitinophagaceae bacterium]|nr:AhpC/TSA family protein [Chitinophagaceae bacterium]